jgi:hypothetical protein
MITVFLVTGKSAEVEVKEKAVASDAAKAMKNAMNNLMMAGYNEPINLTAVPCLR